MRVATAYSTQKDAAAAVVELKSQLTGVAAPALVLFFASAMYAPDALAAEMAAAFPGAQTMGCTTAGELVTGRMLQHSLVAMAFGPEILPAVQAYVIENMRGPSTLPQVQAQIADRFGAGLDALPFDEYVGIILTDGMSVAEEKIMDEIGNLANITVIGGSAGDDLAFKETFVFVNGKAYSNAAALAILKPGVAFDVVKTQSFCALDKTLIATKVNEEAREVIEFNGKPAVHAYAEAVGKPVAEAGSMFMRHPVGLMADGEPFVRSPQQFKGESIVFYCNVKEGAELALLESGDIIEDTRRAMAEKEAEMGGFSAVVNFHCILRTLELREKNIEPAYGAVFTSAPMVGFSTYGEQYIGHINQTSTILVFGK